MGRFSKSENEQLKQTLENACSNREELAWARVKLNAIMNETRDKLLPVNPWFSEELDTIQCLLL